MHQAKVLGRKCVAHLMRPRIEGMALNARLHPDCVDLLPKMLLGIAEDVLCHCLSQGVVRLIVDRNIHQFALLLCHPALWRPCRCVVVRLTREQGYAARMRCIFYAESTRTSRPLSA